MHRWLDFCPDGIFVDVGANIGLYTVLALPHYGYRGAWCYEPNTAVARILARNMALNFPLNFPCIRNFALSDRAGIARMAIPKNDRGRGSIREDGELEVTLRRFDEDFTFPIDQIRMVKIDVEGHEYEALSGMKNALKSMRRARVFVEIHRRNPTRDASIQLLESKGFRLVEQIRANYLFEK